MSNLDPALPDTQSYSSRSQSFDPFMHAISKYKEVPDWWYISISLLSFVLDAIALSIYPTNPVWSLVIVGLADVVYLPPLGIIQGVNGFQVGLVGTSLTR
ncbi:hypothetical protein V1509DRAFT_495499 [Lipomyces kononenkoae]